MTKCTFGWWKFKKLWKFRGSSSRQGRSRICGCVHHGPTWYPVRQGPSAKVDTGAQGAQASDQQAGLEAQQLDKMPGGIAAEQLNQGFVAIAEQAQQKGVATVEQPRQKEVAFVEQKQKGDVAPVEQATQGEGVPKKQEPQENVMEGED